MVQVKVLIYLSRYLDEETVKRPFRSSSQAATCYCRFNHSKVEQISLIALLKDTKVNLPACYSYYPLFMLDVKQGSCEYQLLSLLV